MSPEKHEFIRTIHSQPVRLVLAITGGGASAIGELLTVPGGSQTVLEARVPYAEAALAEWLGAPPEQACSSRTARAMAMAAYLRACQLEGPDGHPAGVGVTASLATDRPKRGDHRIHAAYQTRETTGVLTLVLNKGARTRAEEETLAAELTLRAVAEASGLTETPPLALLGDEQLVCQQSSGHSEWQQLLSGACDRVTLHCPAATEPVALYPGAFNPMHEGHAEIASVAEQILSRRVLFELSIANVDKPPLDYVEIESRAGQFAEQPLLLTRAATFVEKARLFPRTPFVVGADTMLRIGDAKYYGGSPEQRDTAIAELKELGASFLVFGRKMGGDYCTLDALDLPEALAALAIEVPEAKFRCDLSSTELRNRPE